MDEKVNDRFLQHAAQRASRRTFFVSSALSTYQDLEKIGEDQLANFLGCSPQNLSKLALCRRPNASTANFRDEVRQIADYAEVNQVRLAQLFRKVDSLTALKSVPSLAHDAPGNVLIAACDRLEDSVSENLSSAESPCSNELDSNE